MAISLKELLRYTPTDTEPRRAGEGDRGTLGGLGVADSRWLVGRSIKRGSAG